MILALYVAALLMANPVLLAVLLAVIMFLLWRFAGNRAARSVYSYRPDGPEKQGCQQRFKATDDYQPTTPSGSAGR